MTKKSVFPPFTLKCQKSIEIFAWKICIVFYQSGKEAKLKNSANMCASRFPNLNGCTLNYEGSYMFGL